jgi:hypothetical protein
MSNFRFDASDRPQVIMTSGTAYAVPIGLFASAVWDPPAVVDGATTSVDIAVPGATVGDFAQCSFSVAGVAPIVGFMLSAYVSAPDTVTVFALNKVGITVNLASGTLSVFVTKLAPT